MARIRTKRSTRSDELLSVLSGFDQLLVVTHDNPDPDAVAAGWAVQCLVEEKLRKPSRLIGSGAIVRAENRHMVELLQPPIELVDELEVAPGAGVILVDCGPGATNHLLARQAILPVAVIDHHLNGERHPRVLFRDVRSHAAASATIAASYLREQKIDPGVKLATALLYAIRTETQGIEIHYSRLDRSILPWLTDQAEPALLAAIESAPLSREYFSDLVLAMQSTFIYDDAAFCLLPRAEGPEIVGEVADLLIRSQGIRRVFCGAVVGNDLLVSIRTSTDGPSAAELVQETLAGLGQGGGHAHRAGGKIPDVARRAKITEDLIDALRSRWLTACQITRQRGTRLVARRDIVDNL